MTLPPLDRAPRHRGFSLLEMATVIVIISLLSAAGFYAYNNLQQRAQDNAAATALATWAKATASTQDLTTSLRVRLDADVLRSTVPTSLRLPDGCDTASAPTYEQCREASQIFEAAFATSTDQSAAELTTLSESGRCVTVKVETTTVYPPVITNDDGVCVAVPPTALAGGFPAYTGDSDEDQSSFVETEPGTGDGTPITSTLAGLVWHLDAAEPQAFELADGDQVASWRDQSGSTYDAVQTAAANRPTWSSSAFNGRPGVVFDGATDLLTVPTLPSGLFSQDTATTTVWVIEPSSLAETSGSTDSPILFSGEGHNYLHTIGDGADPAAVSVRRNTGLGWESVTPAGLTASTAATVAFTYSPSAGTVSYRDGRTIALDSSTRTTQTSSRTATIGAHSSFSTQPGRFFDGVIAEVLIYDRALTASELGQLNAHLAAKWGLTLDPGTAPLPMQLPDVAVWYDADDAGSFDAASGEVAAWYDRSGHGKTLEASAAARRPARVDGPAGRSAVAFDGVDDTLISPGVRLGELTQFVVMSSPPVSPMPATLVMEHGANVNSINGHYLNTQNGAASAVRRSSTHTSRRIHDNWLRTGEYVANTLTYAGTNASLQTYLNGTPMGESGAPNTVNPGVVPTTQPLYVGSRNDTSLHTEMHLAELLIYDRALTTAEIATVNDYLHAKWDIDDSFQPNMLAGLRMWLDADDASTFTLASGNVSQWRDRSGAFNHAAQSSSSLRPARATDAVNGRATVRFTEDYLDTTRIPQLGSSSYAVFAAGVSTLPDDAGSTRGGIVYGNYQSTATTSFGFELWQDRRLRHWWDARADGGTFASSAVNFASPTPQQHIPYVATWHKDHGAGRYGVTVNDVSAADVTEATPSITVARTPRIGVDYRSNPSSVWYQGDIGEVLVYDRALSASERILVEQYLDGRWRGGSYTPGPAQVTGGTVTEAGGYRYHTFTASGILDVTSAGEVEYLVVAGGGGGGGGNIGGGGGAGGVLHNVGGTPRTLTEGSHTITVGAGGAGGGGNVPGDNGTNSTFDTLVAVGGGGGGTHGSNHGRDGGSGGGGRGNQTAPGGSGTPGQGHDGGDGDSGTGGGGGGGASAPGMHGRPGNYPGGDGGGGLDFSTVFGTGSGDSGRFGGGGGGGGHLSTPGGAGGAGGGGDGGGSQGPYGNGVATSGGGGGGGPDGGQAGDGGSGVVIIRYPIG